MLLILLEDMPLRRQDLLALLIIGQQIHLMTDRADQAIIDLRVQVTIDQLALAIIDPQVQVTIDLRVQAITDLALQADLAQGDLAHQAEVQVGVALVLLAEVQADPLEAALEDPEEEGEINSPFFYPKFSVSPFI